MQFLFLHIMKKLTRNLKLSNSVNDEMKCQFVTQVYESKELPLFFHVTMIF